MNPHLSVANLYAAWLFARSFLHRGWWLVTSLYLVTEAQLSPFQLVFLGTAQGLTVLAAEVPTGVIADTYSRKWSIVIGHGVMGLGMLSTGLVTSFPALIVTQMIWGLSWTFSTGADVAWLTDEMNRPGKTPEVLIRGAAWGQAGSAFGIVVLGVAASITSLSLTIVIAGTTMWILGAAVALAFPEARFRRSGPTDGHKSPGKTLREGLVQLRAFRVLVLILSCTFLVNGADEAFGRLYTKQLVDLGLPEDAEPIVWLSLLSIVALALSVVALAILTRLLARSATFAGLYSAAAGTGAVGFALFAMAPSAEIAMVGVLGVTGIAMTVMRTVSAIWANAHATSEVRATIQSFLSLAEHAGEIALGFVLAIVAETEGIATAMIAGCTVLLMTTYLVKKRGSTP